MNFLTESELEECYAMAEDETVLTADGAVPSERKRFAMDQVISAFGQHVTEHPNVKPTHAELRRRVRSNLERNQMYNGRGEQVYGFAILVVVMMALISWAVQKLAEYLWDRWHQKTTEH